MNDLFSIKDFIPHGYCLAWSPGLLWLHVIADLLITLSYYSIPLFLIYFIRQRKDLPYPWLVGLFAGFIVACGTTHLLSAITIWLPLYWLDGFVKGITAIISLVAAAMMLWIIPRALSLPSTAQLHAEIQQRKAVEEALRESEYRWKFAIEGAGDGVWDCDVVNNTVFFSKRWKEMLGFTEDEVGNNLDEWEKRLHPDDKEAAIAVMRDYLEGKIPAYSNEYRVRSKDGSYKWILARGMVVSRSEEGKPLRLIGTHADISERKLMEEKLRDSDALNASILDSLTSQIAVLDAQGVIISVNKAWRSFAKENGWPESNDMLGINYLDVCKQAVNQPYGDEASAAYKGIKAVLNGEQAAFSLEYPCQTPNKQLWFYMTVTPLQGSRRGVVVRHLNITERKQAERVLMQLKAMIDISLDGFWIVDLMSNLVQVNQAYAQISGYSIDELTNMSITQFEAQESTEQINVHFAKVITEGYDRFETQHRHKDGHIIDVEISVAFLPEFQQFCVFCRDITDRKAMEAELKASEAKFRSIIEASPVPMALNDEYLNITFLNPAFVKTFGYNLSDIPTVADWWPKAYPDPDYRQWVTTTWQTALEKARKDQAESLPMECVIRCKNNSIKTVIISDAEIINSAHEHLVILYDVTQLKQIEAKLNAIFNASVEGIITIDMGNIMVSANTAVETIFGYKPEELVGCGISKLIPSLPITMNYRGTPISEKSASQIQEIEGFHKNGSIVPLELSIAEYSLDETNYFTCIVRDVSRRKHQEQQDKEHLDQLAHVTRLGLMGEMASGIAHEVNQPLVAVSSYTQVSLNLINAENPDLVALSEILIKTQQQALRAGQIIHRMREFVKSHAKHRSSHNINTLIHEAASLCAADLKKNNIELILVLQHNLPLVHVDQVQIEQVIINLIRNSIDALKYLPAQQHRHVTILSQLTANNGLQVSVKDNGPGIDLEQQQKILMPFYTTKTNGMGMGLSISRSLVEAHDGTLNFDSQPGKGTTFYFTLPIQQN
ncbi:MAG: PAS domain S-box protein [Methylococcaceae bacterium]|nr:PAS domain S-box protein [Methylococcaceae bacterium]MDZ4155572.1 PAS domain S-box protein [Methylococcales bacterium]MDP2395295.1 PAS domain S-box protein [Methylococcaceae bacterium]MDP3020593.1 PAS domain S-box protein [Methylococcaceae bacterium]MDP3390032.1 PAS domain S-box protein [Methylococcaceae bacterium]